jgi:hypothetical protein
MTDAEFLDMLEARCNEADKVYGGPRRVSLTHKEAVRVFDIRGYRSSCFNHAYTNMMAKQLRKQIEMGRNAIAQRIAAKLTA